MPPSTKRASPSEGRAIGKGDLEARDHRKGSTLTNGPSSKRESGKTKKRMRPSNVVFLVLIGSLASRDALALGPIDVEVASKVGYGVNPASGTPNPFALGFGARAGVVFSNFYGGLSIVDYVGSGAGTDFTQSALLYGLEAGFDFSVLGRLTVRPEIGVGDAILTSTYDYYASGNLGVPDSDYASPTSSGHHLYLEPGATVLFSIGNAFVGAGVSVLIIPGTVYGTQTNWAAPTVHAQLGIKFQKMRAPAEA